MNQFTNIIITVIAVRFFLKFWEIFRGLYLGYLIDVGSFSSDELDKFPLHLNSEEEYRCILRKLAFFVEQILDDENCNIAIASNDINSLVYQGSVPVKPYCLKDKVGLLFYYFEGNRLFRKSMDYAGPGGVYSIEEEILFIPKVPYATKEETFTEPKIFVREDFVYPSPPSNKLEEWIRNKELNNGSIKGAFMCRSRFISSLFNSDLNFTKEEIINALNKITLVEIVNNQLIFYANGESNS